MIFILVGYLYPFPGVYVNVFGQISSRRHEPTWAPKKVAFWKGNGTTALSGKSRWVKYSSLGWVCRLSVGWDICASGGCISFQLDRMYFWGCIFKPLGIQ